jgi:hypothetical protein
MLRSACTHNALEVRVRYGRQGPIVDDLVHWKVEVGTGVFIKKWVLANTIGQSTTYERLVYYLLQMWSYCIRGSPSR